MRTTDLNVEICNPVSANPMVRALRNILSLCQPKRLSANAAHRTILCSYSDDFSLLWGVDESKLLDGLTRNDVIVVVRDNRAITGADLVEVHQHLTVLDWAVWYCLARITNSKSGVTSIPGIVIVESQFGGQKTPPSDADRFFSMFANRAVPALPWIKTVQIIPQSGETSFLIELLQHLSQREVHLEKPNDLSLIRQIWQSFFLRPTIPSDNHALANVLGAGLLTGNLGSSPIRQALGELLTTLELLPNTALSPIPSLDPNHVVAQKASELFERLRGTQRNRLEFLLVDDSQARHNWFGFVASFLGIGTFAPDSQGKSNNKASGKSGSFDLSLSATESAHELIDCVKTAIDNHQRLRWKTVNPLDLLMLDLRLFERSSLREEGAFYLKVIELLRQFGKMRRSSPGDWLLVHDRELDQSENWCQATQTDSANVSRDDIGYLDTLTLLPRLVALVDPDLPIIMFSSTQKRRVAESLKLYPTILTGFSKPPLQLGQTTENIHEVILRFQRVIVKGIELILGRRLRVFLQARNFAVPWRDKITMPVGKKPSLPWSVQLLLDESESEVENKLTVGGFLVVYPPGVSLAEIDHAIYKKRPEIRLEKEKIREKHLFSKIIQDVVAILDDEKVLIVPVALTGTRSAEATAHSSWRGSDVFQDELVADNLHRELMRCLIELGLFVFARQILPTNASVEFSFHAPTRVLTVDEKEAQKLDDIWGVRSQRGVRGDLIAFHLESNSARALLEEVLREYRGSPFEPIPVLARAFGINNVKGKESQQVRALHFLTDAWLANRRDETLANFNGLAIRGDYSKKLSRLLVAHRRLVRGNRPEAVAIGAQVAQLVKVESESVALNSILVALQNGANAMTGSESVSLSAHLRRRVLESTETKLIGKVVRILPRDGSLQIDSNGIQFIAFRKNGRINFKLGDRVEFVPRRGRRVGTQIASQVTLCEDKSDGQNASPKSK